MQGHTKGVKNELLAPYYFVKNSFCISNTIISQWLCVHRSSLYKWMLTTGNQTKCTQQVKNRLDNLISLSNAMEPEHRPLLMKIAFSPIYGDTKFGDSILNGLPSDMLIAKYRSLFSQFESLRRTKKQKSNIS